MNGGPDGTGELADISCGDPWYRKPDGENPGSSLIVVRTERGREVVKRAAEAGYLEIKPAERWKLVNSQAGLLQKKGSVWGRRLALRLMGLPVTRFKGLSLFHCWWRLGLAEQAKSVLGTLRRVVQRGHYRRLELPEANRKGEAPAVVFMGASLGTGNRGVSALGASMIWLAKRFRPEARVAMLLGQRTNAAFVLNGGSQSLKVEVLNFRKSPRSRLGENLFLWFALACLYRALPLQRWRAFLRRRFPLIRASAEASFLGDIRGGDSFSDIYGLRNFLAGSLPVLAVLLVRRQIALLPQTYGPYQSGLARWVARFILRRASIILSRDRESMGAVAGLIGTTERCRFCPDVAFSLGARLPEKLLVDPPLPGVDREHLVGLNVNGLMYHGGYTRNNMFGLSLDYPLFLVRLAQDLLAQNTNHVLLVPHTFAPPDRVESDPAACRAVRDRLAPELRSRTHLVNGEYDQHEIKGVIGMCGFFVGSRLHSCIAALSQGIPTVGVAYSKKFSGVFDTVGAADWVVDGRYLDVDQAVAATMEIYRNRDLHRAQLDQKVKEAQARLYATFEQLVTP